LVEIILFIVESGCSKHMTGNLKLLTNFVEKFLGTVKFRNDQIAPILDETPRVLIDFLTLVQRGLHAQVTTVRTDKGTEFLNKTLHAYFAKEGIRHVTSTARTPEQNRVVERRNRTLVKDAQTMLSATKVLLFFWAKAIATACFTQNRSLVIPRHEKTPYHIINARKPSVKFFYIFGSLFYVVRDGENLDKMKEKGKLFDSCTSKVDSEPPHGSNVDIPHIHECKQTLDVSAGTSINVQKEQSLDLSVDSLSPGPQSQENVPQVAETVTTSNELELLYSPMFSELLNGTSHVVSKSSAVSEKTSPRSDLRWKPTGRIFNSVDLRWIPTGKLFDSCTSKVDSEPLHGSNVDIPHIHECKQTLDVSAGTSINVQKEQSLDLNAGTLCNINKENLRVWLLKRMISQKPLSKWIHK
ncbi:gag-pol polyprotein, partial [Tanacetum coccineum]